MIMAAGFAKLVLVMGLGVAGCSSPEDMQRDVGVDQDKAAAAASIASGLSFLPVISAPAPNPRTGLSPTAK